MENIFARRCKTPIGRVGIVRKAHVLLAGLEGANRVSLPGFRVTTPRYSATSKVACSRWSPDTGTHKRIATAAGSVPSASRWSPWEH
jgi:hypothetical protein